MELPEDVYEDELIDAFDAPEPEVQASTKLPITSPHHKSMSLGQPTCSNVQEFHTKTNMPTLYPTFDNSDQEAPVVGARTPSEPKQQHQRITSEVQKLDAVLLAQSYRDEEQMTEADLQRRQLQVEREMRMYQERFNHMAQALAGETPHQIQERKKREEERLERREKRYEAVETRLQHQLERLEEREERRARLQARHHRASISPSPSSD